MPPIHNFVRVHFTRFKAFPTFRLDLRHFNILVGPNNAGKSTILTAFRILAAAMRKAQSRKPEIVRGPRGDCRGHQVDMSGIAVSEENIFFNYNDSEAASVKFILSNKNELTLYFPEQGACYLIPDAQKPILSPSHFCSQFNCSIGFVPILGPVEHNEPLYEREAARLALFNYRAARNFRNIWHHYPERFNEFRQILKQTWPGMDVAPPRIERSHEKPKLYMFCPEERIPREIFWAGFGFQVWCQMLTHIIQSSDAALFLIDEPDIYLHSDLQRQLLSLLRNMGPDILIATHSTEIITEAEADDIILISKARKAGRRIRQPSDLHDVFSILGSNLNPVLTPLAKTRRVLFVEGKDFLILAKFARKLGFTRIGNRSEFAVVPIEGFNPERIRNLKAGMEATLGGKISAAAILDKDYRSDVECAKIADECRSFCRFVAIHRRKEIENFLLVPSAIDRSTAQKIADNAKRSGQSLAYSPVALDLLERFASEKQRYVTAQYIDCRRRFERGTSAGLSDATIMEAALAEVESSWRHQSSRLAVVPGKDALSFPNKHLQELHGVTVTDTAVIDAMNRDEVPEEMRELISNLADFASSKPTVG